MKHDMEHFTEGKMISGMMQFLEPSSDNESEKKKEKMLNMLVEINI